MAKAIGELQGSAAFGSDEKQGTIISRRALMLGSAASLVTAGGLGAKFVLGSKNEAPVAEAPAEEGLAPVGEKSPNDYSVSAVEAEANINQLILPDLYENRSWADPEQLIGLPVEELKEIAAIPITNNTLTDEGFTEEFGHKLELIANAGRTLQDVKNARNPEEGSLRPRYAVGETDSLGNELGNYTQYIDEQFISPMLEGLVGDGPKDQDYQEVTAILKEVMLIYGKDYELALTEDLWKDKATLFVETNLIKQLSSTETSRTLSVGIEIRRPAIFDYQEDIIHEGKITLAVHDNKSGTYDIELHDIFL